MRYVLTIILLLFSTLVFAQDDPQKPSKYSPQKEKQTGPVRFHVIPDFAIGASFSEQQFTSTAAEAIGQVRIPGLILPQINGTSTGFMVEFSNPSGPGMWRYQFASYTRVPIAAGLFTGADLRFAEGVDGIGTVANASAAAVVGFNFVSFFDTATLSFEVGLFAPEEPVRFLVVLGF